MKCIFFIRHIPIIIFLGSLNAACSQVNLNVVIDNNDHLWLGGSIKIETSIVNNGHSKVRVRYPAGCTQMEFFYKNNRDSVWRQINYTCISDDAGSFVTIEPGESTFIRPWVLQFEELLESNAQYTLKSVYYPTRSWGASYDPNLKKQTTRVKYIIIDVPFATGPLPPADQEALQWLKEKEILRLYLHPNDSTINRSSFEKIVDFLNKFPNSTFSNKMKCLYIIYATNRQPAPENLSRADYEKALRYWQDVQNGDFPLETFRLIRLRDTLRQKRE